MWFKKVANDSHVQFGGLMWSIGGGGAVLLDAEVAPISFKLMNLRVHP